MKNSKRVEVADLLAIPPKQQPSSILTESTFDKKQSIEKVELKKIYNKKRNVRFRINEEVVQAIIDTMPIINLVCIRTRNPALDSDVPEDFEYVTLTGHHRFVAMERTQIKEALFTLIPRHEVDTRQKIIFHQLAENTCRIQSPLFD